MLFLTFSNMKVNLNNRKLKQRFYTTVKALFTIEQIDLVDRKEFIPGALYLEDEILRAYVVSIAISDKIHSFHIAQIAISKMDETHTTIFSDYSQLTDVFSPELVAELLKYIVINNHIIDSINGKQLSYKLIHSLGPVELKILKTYIKINLVNGFTRFSKFSSNVQIFYA